MSHQHGSASPTKVRIGKGFAIGGLVIAGIGILPLLIYAICCVQQLGTRSAVYWQGSHPYNPLIVIVMGAIGVGIHLLGGASSITGLCLGSKKVGTIGLVGNLGILAMAILMCLLALGGA